MAEGGAESWKDGRPGVCGSAVAQAHAQRAQSSAYCAAVAVSKCFIFEQRALHFRFARGLQISQLVRPSANCLLHVCAETLLG